MPTSTSKTTTITMKDRQHHESQVLQFIYTYIIYVFFIQLYIKYPSGKHVRTTSLENNNEENEHQLQA